MLVVYNTSTGEVTGISGYRHGVISEENIKAIRPVGPLPERQAYFHIFDPEVIANLWGLVDERARLEVVFDDEGNPVGVRPKDESEESSEGEGSPE